MYTRLLLFCGSPVGMQYRTNSYAEGVWTVYWFEKNVFGDVVAIYTNTGVSSALYYYDAFGQCKFNSAYATNPTHPIARNPFRYRGYYYDIDLGMYYVNARYYDQNIGRWISPEPNVYSGGFDVGTSILGYNVYAYCMNNPVMYVDHTGESIAGVVAGAVVGALGGAAIAYMKGENIAVGAAVGAFVGGGLTIVGDALSSGVVAGSAAFGVAFAISTVVGGAIGAIANIGSQLYTYNSDLSSGRISRDTSFGQYFDCKSMGISIAASAFAGAMAFAASAVVGMACGSEVTLASSTADVMIGIGASMLAFCAELVMQGITYVR